MQLDELEDELEDEPELEDELVQDESVVHDDELSSSWRWCFLRLW